MRLLTWEEAHRQLRGAHRGSEAGMAHEMETVVCVAMTDHQHQRQVARIAKAVECAASMVSYCAPLLAATARLVLTAHDPCEELGTALAQMLKNREWRWEGRAAT